MKVATYKCEVDGKLKAQGAQGWWVVRIYSGNKSLSLLSWDDTEAATEGSFHYCSYPCVLKRVQEFCEGK